jgi:hypothetical protein
MDLVLPATACSVHVLAWGLPRTQHVFQAGLEELQHSFQQVVREGLRELQRDLLQLVVPRLVVVLVREDVLELGRHRELEDGLHSGAVGVLDAGQLPAAPPSRSHIQTQHAVRMVLGVPTGPGASNFTGSLCIKHGYEFHTVGPIADKNLAGASECSSGTHRRALQPR